MFGLPLSNIDLKLRIVGWAMDMFPELSSSYRIDLLRFQRQTKFFSMNTDISKVSFRSEERVVR